MTLTNMKQQHSVRAWAILLLTMTTRELVTMIIEGIRRMAMGAMTTMTNMRTIVRTMATTMTETK